MHPDLGFLAARSSDEVPPCQIATEVRKGLQATGKKFPNCGCVRLHGARSAFESKFILASYPLFKEKRCKTNILPARLFRTRFQLRLSFIKGTRQSFFVCHLDADRPRSVY